MNFLTLLSAVFALQVPTHWNLGKGEVAVEGYDIVSYYSGDEPTEGRKSISTTKDGIVYLFSSEANKKEFLTNSSKYQLAYGGWCAYAIGATGDKVKVDPETFKIIDDKLYLFYNFWGNNTLKDWNKDEGNLKKAGDDNWDRIIGSN